VCPEAESFGSSSRKRRAPAHVRSFALPAPPPDPRIFRHAKASRQSERRRNRNDRYHSWAVRVTEPLLTCDAALAETTFHLAGERIPRLAELAARYAGRTSRIHARSGSASCTRNTR
jgi:hypothetical protein